MRSFRLPALVSLSTALMFPSLTPGQTFSPCFLYPWSLPSLITFCSAELPVGSLFQLVFPAVSNLLRKFEVLILLVILISELYVSNVLETFFMFSLFLDHLFFHLSFLERFTHSYSVLWMKL